MRLKCRKYLHVLEHGNRNALNLSSYLNLLAKEFQGHISCIISLRFDEDTLKPGASRSHPQTKSYDLPSYYSLFGGRGWLDVTKGGTTVKKKMMTVLAIGVLVAGCIGSAEATPGLFESNYYEFVQVTDPLVGANNSWATANAAASARIYNGVNGHLATITSVAENNFLYGLTSGVFSNFTGSWIGVPSSSFTNWGGSEPNNGGGYAYMHIGTTTYAGIAPREWADAVGNPWACDPVVGYFVEYEKASPVPEPATMLLFGLGLLGLAGIRRKMK